MEVSMARRLVKEMTRKWQPQRFHDTYREDLMQRIREKIKAKQTHVLDSDDGHEPARPKAEVIDLMEALKKSLKGRPSTRAPRKAAASRRRA
jgi:DNA end-binding protein Ku